MPQRALVVSFLAIAAIMLAVVPAAHAESLTSVVRRTLATNPDLKALSFNRQAIDQELEAARGLSLPSVDARLAAGHRYRDGESGAPISTHTRSSRNRYEAGVTVSQRLFDGGETRGQVERQLNRVESARSRVKDTANAIALQATQAYLEIQRTSRVRAIARENVSAHETLLKKVRDRAQAGRGASSEVEQASARLNAARAAAIESEARHRDAVSLFIAVVGTRPPAKLQPVSPPARAIPANVDVAVTQAQRGSPAIVARMFDAAAASASIDIARSAFAPKITAELSADYYSDRDRITGQRGDVTGMIVMRQNLYRGGIDTARVREAEARASEAMATADLMRRTIEREVRLSWTSMTTARARSEVIGRQLEHNRNVIRAYREQFELGQRTLLDLLDVQNELFVNETTLTTETFVANFNVFRVLAAMGRLVPSLGIDYNEEARRMPVPTGAIIP
jgi:adhesin transport system outer membrane protein